MQRPALPDPPTAAHEKTTLCAFLDWYRDNLVRKVEGLDREAATRRLVPSRTTLLGIVKHLAYVERGWFQNTFLGLSLYRPINALHDAEFVIEEEDTVESVLAFYQQEVTRSRAIVADAALDDHARRQDRTDFTLRWIVVHMIEERPVTSGTPTSCESRRTAPPESSHGAVVGNAVPSHCPCRVSCGC